MQLVLIVHVCIICPHPQCPEEIADLQRGNSLGFISSRISAEKLSVFGCDEEERSPENSFSFAQEQIQVFSGESRGQKETAEETKREGWALCVRTVSGRPKKQDNTQADVSDCWRWWHRWYICICGVVTLWNWTHPRTQIIVCWHFRLRLDSWMVFNV